MIIKETPPLYRTITETKVSEEAPYKITRPTPNLLLKQKVAVLQYLWSQLSFATHSIRTE